MKLTEKDAIWCKTQKQWDCIIKLFDLDILATAFERYSKNCITPIQKEIITSYGEKKYYKSQGYTIHKAKDILKKSFKKDVLKRLEKIENSNVKLNISKMKPNFNYSDLDCDLPTKELEELPEKWCIVLTEKNRDTLTVWLGYSKIESPIGSYVGFDKHLISLIAEPWYTEITFEQFKKWVLKEEQKPLSIREVQVKVSNQEEANECAEIAKARGEEVDKEINSLMLFGNQVVFRKKELNNDFGVYAESNNFKTISLQELRERFGKTEIDWSKAGQLVENKNGAVRITNGKHTLNNFFGTLLYPASPEFETHVGTILNNYGYPKNEWKLCTEQITLKNE